MRIASRLRAVSIATIAAIFLLAPYLISTLIDFRSAKSDFVLAERIKNNFFERASIRDQYYLHREDQLRAQWEQSKAAADLLLLDADSQFVSAEDRDIVARLRRAIDETSLIFRRIVGNTEALQKAGNDREVLAEFDKRLYSQLLLKASAVHAGSTALQEASETRVERAYEGLIIAVSLFSAMLVLATVIVSLQIKHLIGKRLAPLHAGAAIVAGGDLDHRIACAGSDEFSELAQSINAMTGKLQEFTIELEARVRERTAEVVSERDRAQSYLDIAGVMLMVLDGKGRIVMINRKGVDLLGAAESDLLGADWFARFAANDLALRQSFEVAAAGGETAPRALGEPHRQRTRR